MNDQQQTNAEAKVAVERRVIQQLDKIIGYFEPKRIDNLVEAAKQFIGKLLIFEALWLIDEEDGGPYVGQYAMRACDNNGDWLSLGWVPLEDIRIEEITDGKY